MTKTPSKSQARQYHDTAERLLVGKKGKLVDVSELSNIRLRVRKLRKIKPKQPKK